MYCLLIIKYCSNVFKVLFNNNNTVLCQLLKVLDNDFIYFADFRTLLFNSINENNILIKYQYNNNNNNIGVYYYYSNNNINNTNINNYNDLFPVVKVSMPH